MSLSPRLTSRTWLIVPICSFLFLIWTDYRRAQRVDYVSGIAAEDALADPISPTGYAKGERWLIVPEHNNRSYQWISETQQMLAKDEWRVRRIDYENAPYGREVHSASPYRWWLGAIAWCDHAISGRAISLSVEKAALFSEPLLHLLLLVSTTVFVARRFGIFPAALISVGLTTLFPLAALFLPGVPDCYSLMQFCALGSVLPLLAAFSGKTETTVSRKNASHAAEVDDASPRVQWSFFAAGVAGGFGLWISAVDQVPIIEGIALGALVAAWVTRKKPKTNPTDRSSIAPWRVWALGGAVTCLVAYLIEYFPAHLDMRLRVNHPLYGVAWLGLGEMLAWSAWWARQGKPLLNWRHVSVLILAAIAVAALPVAMVVIENQTFLAGDLVSSRLTNLPDGITASSLVAWLNRDGITVAVAATILPICMLVPVIFLLARKTTGSNQRLSVAIALGPIFVALLLAYFQLRWWSTFDILLLSVMVVATTIHPPQRRWLWSGFAMVIFGFGIIELTPNVSTGSADFKFTRAEVEGLYERALAHWIKDHAGPSGAVVLVPPHRTASFCFYGGLSGLGTENWENRDGLSANFRIVNSTTPDETQALINERGITHIVIPSWDTDLDIFARMGLKQPEKSFIYALDHWVLFNWLRALPYKLPAISGFEEQSVKVLEVTEVTDAATHRSRLVEYFIEMQQLDLATNASQALRRYPSNLGALVALAQFEKASGDEEGFTKDFNALVSNLSSGSDRGLPWDRRVSLAVVLALGQRNELARAQVQKCLEQINEIHIRSLTTGSLYHLLVLCKVFGLTIPDQKIRELTLQLLPEELRNRL